MRQTKLDKAPAGLFIAANIISTFSSLGWVQRRLQSIR